MQVWATIFRITGQTYGGRMIEKGKLEAAKKHAEKNPAEKERLLLNRLRNSCARREYSRADVLKKALTVLEDSSAAERVADSLVKDGFVSDSRYAAAYAREKASISGWGKIKIRHTLRAKGLSSEDIEMGLREVDDESAASKLRKVVGVKFASLKDDPQRHVKLLRFAMGRGYSYEEVESEIRRCEAGR